MKEEKQNVIVKIEPNSIAEELGIHPGEVLLSINGKKVQDVFDYRYLIQDDFVELELIDLSGESYIAEIEKEEQEDLGIVFASGLMDQAKSCANHCIFCFIDQLPKGMRDTLYFKDDDSRLSFLQGNYVTLTNMSEEDIDRILYYHLSPINISVHTTNPELRVKMLRNPKAAGLLPIMQKLGDAGIAMNLQVVLCRNVNDGEELERTFRELEPFYPQAKSLSVVPIGITQFRQGLYPALPFDRESARDVLDLIQRFQERCLEKHHTRFVYGADEFYLTAERPIPSASFYEDFAQIENGVGMTALLEQEFDEQWQLLAHQTIPQTVSMATGKAAAQQFQRFAKKMMEKVSGLTVAVHVIENNFFGPKITVAGLLTGQDIIKQLKGKTLGQKLLLPANLLKAGETVLLDDVTLMDLEQELSVPIRVVKDSGRDVIDALLRTEERS